MRSQAAPPVKVPSPKALGDRGNLSDPAILSQRSNSCSYVLNSPREQNPSHPTLDPRSTCDLPVQPEPPVSPPGPASDNVSLPSSLVVAEGSLAVLISTARGIQAGAGSGLGEMSVGVATGSGSSGAPASIPGQSYHHRQIGTTGNTVISVLYLQAQASPFPRISRESQIEHHHPSRTLVGSEIISQAGSRNLGAGHEPGVAEV